MSFGVHTIIPLILRFFGEYIKVYCCYYVSVTVVQCSFSCTAISLFVFIFRRLVQLRKKMKARKKMMKVIRKMKVWKIILIDEIPQRCLVWRFLWQHFWWPLPYIYSFNYFVHYGWWNIFSGNYGENSCNCLCSRKVVQQRLDLKFTYRFFFSHELTIFINLRGKTW